MYLIALLTFVKLDCMVLIFISFFFSTTALSMFEAFVISLKLTKIHLLVFDSFKLVSTCFGGFFCLFFFHFIYIYINNALCTGCIYKITPDYLFPKSVNAKPPDHLEKCQVSFLVSFSILKFRRAWFSKEGVHRVHCSVVAFFGVHRVYNRVRGSCMCCKM